MRKPSSITTLTDAPALDALIPKERNIYFTYGGSLTTPPCSEVVTWIDLNTTIPLAHGQVRGTLHSSKSARSNLLLTTFQLDPFRQLEGFQGKLEHNYRPTQPIHGRTIRFNKPDKERRSFFDELFRRSGARSSAEAGMLLVTMCGILARAVIIF